MSDERVIFSGDGNVTTKQMFLQLVKSGDLIHTQMDFEVLNVKVYGNTGIVMQNQMGLLWLTAAVLFLIYGVLRLANAKYAWFYYSGSFTILEAGIRLVLELKNNTPK